MIKMHIYGHAHHGTSRLYISVRSLCFLHYLWPVAIGSINRVETYTSLYNLYMYTTHAVRIHPRIFCMGVHNIILRDLLLGGAKSPSGVQNILRYIIMCGYIFLGGEGGGSTKYPVTPVLAL